MRVLITGGAGFIGSHVAEALLREGHEISVIDELNDFYPPDWKRRNLAEVLSVGPVKFYKCDISDERRVFSIFRKDPPEAVLHLAARAGVRPSLEQPLLYERANVRGTLVLLEAARRTGVGKFLFASSSSVYGASDRVPFSEEGCVSRPLSPYAATKLAGESFCHSYSHLYGLEVACLRLFTVYGPRLRPDLAIRKFTSLILAGKPIPVFGDGMSSRDYTYIDDIVSGILAALRRRGGFEVFNLGNSSPVSLEAMVQTIESALGRTARIERHPEQAGDMHVTYADVSKAASMLGYRPMTPFAEGIRRFVAWFLRFEADQRDQAEAAGGPCAQRAAARSVR